jgi:hypothetical protein
MTLIAHIPFFFNRFATLAFASADARVHRNHPQPRPSTHPNPPARIAAEDRGSWRSSFPMNGTQNASRWRDYRLLRPGRQEAIAAVAHSSSLA